MSLIRTSLFFGRTAATVGATVVKFVAVFRDTGQLF